ncbi:MAG: alpha/beta fold hydrolase [Saprospiraceae bacterium]
MSSVNLNYKKLGYKKPLIILHGLFGSLDNWQTIANNLQDDFTIYLIDLRNHGRSTHTDEMSYSLMAEDIISFMELQDIPSCKIIGHSMGGKVVLELLKDFPYKIEKAIVIDISVKAYKGHHEEIFKGMYSLNLSTLSKRTEADNQLTSHIPDSTTRQFILKSLDRKSDGSFEWKVNLNALYNNYSNINAEIKFTESIDSEVLFLMGENSNYLNAQDEIELKGIFPNATFLTIKGAGHWVHAEKPLETLNAIKHFFQ